MPPHLMCSSSVRSSFSARSPRHDLGQARFDATAGDDQRAALRRQPLEFGQLGVGGQAQSIHGVRAAAAARTPNGMTALGSAATTASQRAMSAAVAC